MNKKQAMYARITKHGEQLITLFKLPEGTDPIKLCKSLRRIEKKAKRAAEGYCNIPYFDIDAALKPIHKLLSKLLGYESKRVWVNRDPRGYALKIDLAEGETLYTDLGSNGIIAPDLTNI